MHVDGETSDQCTASKAFEHQGAATEAGGMVHRPHLHGKFSAISSVPELPSAMIMSKPSR